MAPALPRDLRRRVRRARRGRVVHPDLGARRELLQRALDVRLGYLVGAPDLTAADVGAAVLASLAPGPDTRRRTTRTLSGFLSEHHMRASCLAPGRVLRTGDEERLAADAVLLAHLSAVAGDDPGPGLAAAEPARTGLDDDRLTALVDERVVRDVVRLTGAAERSLWRPLATTHVARGRETGTWTLGERDVVVDVGGRRVPAALGTALHDAGAAGRSLSLWLARHERLLDLVPGAGVAARQDQPAS